MTTSDPNATEQDRAVDESGNPIEPRPGLLLLACNGAAFGVLSLGKDAVVVGREGDFIVDDKAISRRHFSIARRVGTFELVDLAAVNGTFVDGERVNGTVRGSLGVIRAGRSLFIPVEDVTPYLERGVELEDGHSSGPTLRTAHAIIDAAAKSGAYLLIQGESGSGKESAAARYHAQTANRHGRLVVVNCAAIPKELAEGLFFGAKKGAHSGADRDQEGFIAAADGGVLFLDEIGELDLALQAKLLRVLETGDYYPLGSSKPLRMNALVVSATNRNLQEAVDHCTFRRDLLMRIARRRVRLPPLRERIEEICFIAQMSVEALARQHKSNPLSIHPAVFEACLREPWEGENVRGLRNAMEQAYENALLARAEQIIPRHLPEEIRARLEEGPVTASGPEDPRLTQLLAAMARNGGNVVRAAAELRLSTATAYRLLKKRRTP